MWYNIRRLDRQGGKEEVLMKKDDSEVRGVIAQRETGVSTSVQGFVLSRCLLAIGLGFCEEVSPCLR